MSWAETKPAGNKMDQPPTPPHAIADVATLLAIGNVIMGWFPIVISIISGLLAIAWYSTLLYDRFITKK